MEKAARLMGILELGREIIYPLQKLLSGSLLSSDKQAAVSS
jgi:hypothetical protein